MNVALLDGCHGVGAILKRRVEPPRWGNVIRVREVPRIACGKFFAGVAKHVQVGAVHLHDLSLWRGEHHADRGFLKGTAEEHLTGAEFVDVLQPVNEELNRPVRSEHAMKGGN